jgi:hypothetical protein
MAARRKARRARYNPEEDATVSAPKAKAKDRDFSREFKQIGFLGHLEPSHRKKAALRLVPRSPRNAESDNLPLMILGFVLLVLAASIFAVAFLDTPNVSFRFRP